MPFTASSGAKSPPIMSKQIVISGNEAYYIIIIKED